MSEEECYVCGSFAVLLNGLCPSCHKRKISSLEQKVHDLEVINMAQDNTIKRLRKEIRKWTKTSKIT